MDGHAHLPATAGPPGQQVDPASDQQPVRRARRATAVTFLLTGLVFATWAARVPALQDELRLSEAQLGIAFVGLNAGAVLGLQLGAVVVARVGSRPALAVAMPAFAVLLLGPAVAVDLLTLAGALFASALANSVVDVAMNEQGVGVEHRAGRPLLPGLHAMHSLGGVCGGGLAALAAATGLGVVAHFAVVAASAAVLGLAASRLLLPPGQLHPGRTKPGAEAQKANALLGGWTTRLVLLGTVAFVFTLAEGAALDWSAVLLRTLDASPALAAAALSVFLSAVTVGRLLGNRLVARAGAVRVFRLGALIAGSGFAAGLLIGTPIGAVAGLALLGLGLANLLPLAISAAGTSGQLPVAVAVARVSMLGYLGSFAGPALIGFLITGMPLAAALLLPAIGVTATALAARHVQAQPGRPPNTQVI